LYSGSAGIVTPAYGLILLTESFALKIGVVFNTAAPAPIIY